MPSAPAVKNLAKTYAEQGFAIAKGLLPQPMIAAVTKRALQLANWQLQTLGLPAEPILYDALRRLHGADMKRYLATLSALSRLSELHALFFNEPMRQALSALRYEHALVPTGPVMHVMSEGLRIPNGYYGFDTHQDWPSMQGSLQAVVVWIPLVDVDKDLYPLEAIPKSHHRGIWPGQQTPNGYHIDKDQFQESDFIALEAERGDVLFMTVYTVHRSGQKGRDDVRLACSLRFEEADEPYFIERAYPTVYRRSVERLEIDPHFPTQAQATAQFKQLKP